MGLFSEIQSGINFLSYLRNIWESKRSISILLCCVFILGIYGAYKIDISKMSEKITIYKFLIVIFICIFMLFFWFFTRKPKKADKNKLGIVIAISTENKKEQEHLKNDLIENLQDVIKKGHHQQLQLILLSEYHSKRIRGSDSVKLYHKKTRANLIIYGTCKTRTLETKECYYLKINASVVHRLLPMEISRSISTEMNRVLPQKLIFKADNEIIDFMVGAETLGHATRYIIGLGALFSGDIKTALDLHNGLIKEIDFIEQEGRKLSEDLATIRRIIPLHLSDEALILTEVTYIEKKRDYLEKMGEYLEIVKRFDPRNYKAHILRGIYYFLAERNTDAALEEIKKSKNERDNTWQINEAFIKAYKGDLEGAHKLYKRALLGILQQHIPLETEEFIHNILDIESDKIQLWYCLGMINYFFKKDLKLADQYFKRFVKLAKEREEFLASIDFAEKYLKEIDKKLKNSITDDR